MAKKKATGKGKQSLKERIAAKQAALKSKGGNNSIIFMKADSTIRARILNVGEENEWFVEVIQFYLPGVKGVFSPATFGDDCAIMEWYEELQSSKDEDDKALLEKVGLHRKYLVPVAILDDKGKKVDEQNSGKLLQLTKGLLTDTMELFLDEEWGDFTDPTEGYDIKYSREGSGKNDTTYSCTACKPSVVPKPWSRKPIDLEEMVKAIIPSYDQTKEALDKFLSGDTSSDEELDLDEMSRKELKAYIKDNDLNVKVTKEMEDEEIVKKIKRAEKKNKKGDI